MNKASSLITVSCALAIVVHAQTNTFPDIGSVGIGTTTPTTSLDVNGSTTLRGSIYTGGNIELNSFGAGNRYAYIDFHGDDTYSDYGLRIIRDNTGSNAASEMTHRGAGVLRFRTEDSADIRFSLSGTDRVSIRNNGNVGIGTTTPAAMLHIYNSLGVPGASQTNLLKLGVSTANQDGVDVFARRLATGGDWHTAAMFIQRKVDSSSMGFLKFGEWNVALGVGIGEHLLVNNNGNISIGTTVATHKLTVNGPIRAKEVIVDTGWADDVFAEDYALMPLTEVKHHIEANKRLPGVPSAGQVASEGVSVGEMQSLLLRKVEELTLHVIRQQEEIDGLRRKLETR